MSAFTFDVLGSTITGVEGNQTGKVLLGSFTDTNFAASPAVFAGTVNWGDGKPNTPLTNTTDFVVANNGINNSLVEVYAPTVAGSPNINGHIYDEAGTYAITVTFNETNGSGSGPFTTTFGVISSQAVIRDATLAPGSTPTSPILTAIINVPELDIALVNFDDSNPAAPTPAILVNEFSALIDWGDGSPMSQGSIKVGKAPTLTKSNFLVSGNHTYSRPDIYTVKVLVNDDDGEFVTVTNTITVSVIANGVGPLHIETFDMVVKKKRNLHYLANFIDLSNLNLTTNNFVATIDWGDHKPSTTATVQKIGVNLSQYVINAKHKYRHKGKYNMTLNVNGMLSSSVVEVFCNDDDNSSHGSHCD